MHPHLPYRLVETAPPATGPLTLEEAKDFLRVSQDNDDALIASLVTAARLYCEGYTGRSLITRSYSLFFDRWPAMHRFRESLAVELPYPPLVSVAQVNTYAADDSAAVFDPANYYADTAGGRLVLMRGVLPAPGRLVNGIEVRYTAGYGATGDDVPALLRQGMLQLVAHFYEHRGDSPEQALFSSGAAAVFQPYRVMGLP